MTTSPHSYRVTFETRNYAEALALATMLSAFRMGSETFEALNADGEPIYKPYPEEAEVSQ